MKKRHKTDFKVYLAASTIMLATYALPDQAGAQSLNCLEPLLFGSIIPCTTAGDVVISTGGARSTTGCISTSSAPFSRGRCAVTQGFPFRPIKISVTPSPASMSATATSMSVTNFNIITNANGPSTTISPGVPYVDIPIGATLNVGANQASGSYSGTFTVNAVLQ